jgi:CheY-like chemotaxis protein
MNLTYKILWFEDEKDFVDGYKPDLQDYVEELGFKFVQPHIEKDNSNSDRIEFSEYDLILMDYKLSDGNKGDVIINKIRELDIYTEVVFYSSSEMTELRGAIHDKELDGVYCANRGEGFLPKVKDIIRLTLKKVLDINAMRGVVMAVVSDFDEKMLSIISAYLNTINENDANTFLSKRKNKLLSSFDDKKAKINNEQLDTFYKNWNFDATHKWRAVLSIVKMVIPELTEKTKQYESEIIKSRDSLAHVMEVEDPSGNGQKCLAYGDFIFNDESCKKILTALKEHERNFDKILNYFFDKVNRIRQLPPTLAL